MATINVVTSDDRVLSRTVLGVNDRNSALYYSADGKPDGPCPAVGDEGIPVVQSGGVGGVNDRLQILDGLLQAPDLSGGSGDKAAHWQQALPGVKRLGCSFKLGDTSGGQFSAVTLVTWSEFIGVPYIQPPDTGCHLSVTDESWQYGVFEDGDIDYVASGWFETPLPTDWDPAVAGSGTLQRFEVVLEGDTAFLWLPDGTTAIVVDPRIESIPREVAGYELFKYEEGGGDCAFETVWSDTDIGPPGAAGMSEVVRTLRGVFQAITNQRPVYQQYAPANNESFTVPAATTAVDHMPTIAFTLPSGSTVMRVEANVTYNVTAQSKIFMGFRAGSSLFGWREVLNTDSFNGIVHYTGYRVGMEPGTGGEFELVHRVVSGTGAELKLDAPNGYTMDWSITPAWIGD